eukprot:scaffold41469_cov62-Phaeocystis_antarctica.AAC.3
MPQNSWELLCSVPTPAPALAARGLVRVYYYSARVAGRPKHHTNLIPTRHTHATRLSRSLLGTHPPLRILLLLCSVAIMQLASFKPAPGGTPAGLLPTPLAPDFLPLHSRAGIVFPRPRGVLEQSLS